MSNPLPTIEHAGVLDDCLEAPRYILADQSCSNTRIANLSCSFCGVGDGGFCVVKEEEIAKGTLAQYVIKDTAPTTGCAKLIYSQMRQKVAFPIHIAPSLLNREQGRRETISYEEAIDKFADLLLEHRGINKNILVYISGTTDYFTMFAAMEVFRLLGVRNITGNGEHCLNSIAIYNEILTGQEGPFLTIDNSINGPNRFFLLHGWNGIITHPPVFGEILKRENLDAYLIEVMVTESALSLADKIGEDRVLFIKTGSDPLLALAIAHQIFMLRKEAIEQQFIELFSDKESFEKFTFLASSDEFKPEIVAKKIAAEPQYASRIEKAIEDIVNKLTDSHVIPINIFSVGVAQTSGVVPPCLWGNIFAMLGKYGLKSDGSVAGGTLRLPGQINAQTEVQGLSRNYFMGRIPIEHGAEAAIRMGLPENAYDAVARQEQRSALDYSLPTPGVQELFVFIGTQFEANMMERPRWIRKLCDPDTKFIVIDPIPDPFTLEHADLIIPSPPHPATTKLYQNGEWRLSLHTPQKMAPRETRTDPTIIYDVMASICRKLEFLASHHPDLYIHLQSGYLQERFVHLPRFDGEVSRPFLWQRIIDYMSGGSGPLYCRPEHPDGRPISWEELVKERSIIYGGVGKHRFKLDYNAPSPFGDIFRRTGKFKFFVPKEKDLQLPTGIIFNTGRASLSSDHKRIKFAIGSFNSGKGTPIVNMPDENPAHISLSLAKKFFLQTGDLVHITGRISGGKITLPVVVTDRVKGEMVYVSFHKSRAQIEKGHYVNEVTSHEGRCTYTSQTSVKTTQILLEKVKPNKSLAEATMAIRHMSDLAPTEMKMLDSSLIDTSVDLPLWEGQRSPLYVTNIINETQDVVTFRFQGNPLCRFAFLPGQFCTLVLNINNQKVIRSYSISSTPSRPFVLEITVKRVAGGLVSNWLHDTLKIGDRIDITGPKGKFCLSPGKIHKKLLFIGAGSGITPLMSMARWLHDISADIDIQFFNSVRSDQDIIFRKEIELISSRSVKFHPIMITTTQGSEVSWRGLSGRVNKEMIAQVAPDLLERHVYMCGPGGFMKSVQSILSEMGFDLANLHQESFSGTRTSPADKTAPLRPSKISFEATQSTTEKQKNICVSFVKSGKELKTDGQTPILDLAEEQDIDVDYGCRIGNCGACKVKLLEGEIEMDNDAGLSAKEKSEKFILSCVARPKTDCKIDI